MIKILTDEQKSRFPEFVEKWTRIGLCTDPANRHEAEKGIKEAYYIAGMKEPRIVWCGSPMGQGIVRAIVLKIFKQNPGASVGASVRDSVWDSVGYSVWASVWDSVGYSVWDSVRDSVRDSVWAYISTYFDIKYNFDYSSAKNLWERGLVPSFDGKIWRLHTGKNADIVFEIEKSKLQEGL